MKNDYNFKAEGKKVVYDGWLSFYKQYINASIVGTQIDVPILHKDDILKGVDITLADKFTQPPTRFNQSSLLGAMEKEKIGTKAIRSEIIHTLLKRNYIDSVVTTTRK